MSIRFFDVYDYNSMEKIGQVKSDPHRATNKWTAIDKTGRRIKDCKSREAAEQEVQNGRRCQMTLVCSNSECASHKDDSPMFTINVIVDGDLDSTENLKKVEPEYFICVYCQSRATQGGAK